MLRLSTMDPYWRQVALCWCEQAPGLFARNVAASSPFESQRASSRAPRRTNDGGASHDGTGGPPTVPEPWLGRRRRRARRGRGGAGGTGVVPELDADGTGKGGSTSSIKLGGFTSPGERLPQSFECGSRACPRTCDGPLSRGPSRAEELGCTGCPSEWFARPRREFGEADMASRLPACSRSSGQNLLPTSASALGSLAYCSRCEERVDLVARLQLGVREVEEDVRLVEDCVRLEEMLDGRPRSPSCRSAPLLP